MAGVTDRCGRNINRARCTRPGRAGRPSRLELTPSRATAALHVASDGYPGCLDCSMGCSTAWNWLWAALGVGANVYSHQAASGDVGRLAGADLGQGTLKSIQLRSRSDVRDRVPPQRPEPPQQC
jgi:hypothetical protein